MKKAPVPGIERSRPITATSVRMPAEWEAQDAVLLVWPHSDHGWHHVDRVEAEFTELVATLCRYQPVLLVVQNASHHDHVSHLLDTDGIDAQRCHLITARTNDCWARDIGPLSVIENDRPKLLDFQFNGWGNKYTHDHDNRLNTALKQSGVFACAMQSIPLILEGGSIDSDGHGTLLTTRSCLLSKSRNAQYDQDKIEQLLQRFLGAHTIHWLDHGMIAGDDTDGHIDTLARFAPGDSIVYSTCTDKDDVNYEALDAMHQQLTRLKTADDNHYTLIPLPLPTPVFDNGGSRLPANYANFQIINGAVLYPLYNDPMDRMAFESLQQAFPEHKIIGINARAIIEQYGSLHCLCMQLTKKTVNN